MNLYADTILDHYRHPRGKDPIGKPSVEHSERNISCGDKIKLQLTIDEGTVTGVHWDGDGCAISQAAMSMLSEEIIGKSVEELQSLSSNDIVTMLQVPVGPRRIKCAALSLHTLLNTLHIHTNTRLQTWQETVGNGE